MKPYDSQRAPNPYRLRVKSLRALALATALFAPSAVWAQEITVAGLDGTSKVLTAQALGDLPRATAALPNKGGEKAYEGPLLTYVLREAGAPAGAKLHGPAMKTYVVVRGADGFSAVLSLAETDKDFHDGAVILADQADGVKLTGKEGPYRLVIAGDKKASRSVFGVARIELRAAD